MRSREALPRHPVPSLRRTNHPRPGLQLPFALPLLILAATRVAAGPVNPDISVIGDSRLTWSDAAQGDEPELRFEELEVSFVGPLNPYASAEVYLGIHGVEGIEVEEAKLILDRYLKGGLGLTVGQMLLDFGLLNGLHRHAYPWVDRALAHEAFFGEDGLRDMSVRLDWLAPTEGVTLRASLGVVRGDVLARGHAHEEEEHTHEGEGEEAPPDLGGTARVELFAEPSQDFSFLLGVSALHGTFDPAEDARATWLDVDAKARFDLGPSRALVLNVEGVLGNREETDEAPESDPNGFFASADLRASRRWNLGGFVEGATELADDEVRTLRTGAFVGLALMEETTLFRLVGRLTDPDGGGSETDVLLQALFGMGPHGPHRY